MFFLLTIPGRIILLPLIVPLNASDTSGYEIQRYGYLHLREASQSGKGKDRSLDSNDYIYQIKKKRKENGSVGNMGKSFTITIVAITLVSASLSLLGVFSLREPYGKRHEYENIA